MNRVKCTLTFTADPDNDRLGWYSVTAGTSNVVFRGKAYILAASTSLTLDLTDIVSGLVYKGMGVLNPTWNSQGQGYQQPWTGSNYNGSMHSTVIDGTDNEYNISSLTVKLYSDRNYSTQIATTTITNVYFHSIGPMDTKGGTVHTEITDYFVPGFVPHLPKIATKNLLYGQLVHSNANASRTQAWRNSSGTPYASYTLTAGQNATVAMNLYALLNGHTFADNKLYSYSSHSNESWEILRFDECARPYYLIWLNPNGGFQSFGFNGGTTYTEKHTTNMRLTYDDYSIKANQTLTSSWKLKSQLVNDTEYQCIMTAARSPYCILYITDLDRSVLVNVSDTSKDMKTRRNNSNKPFIAELTVETAEKDFIIL